jgi:hypothetical protein
MNNINKAKGNGYRDSNSNPLNTPKGDKARRHDEMVENLLALLQYWDNELDCLHFSIENATEGLLQRPCMNKGWIDVQGHGQIRGGLLCVSTSVYETHPHMMHHSRMGTQGD